jgi:photosystem II stability/assembly factor-like uncharacterized protein
MLRAVPFLISAFFQTPTPTPTWRHLSSGCTTDLRGVSAPGGTVVWATGAKGTILRTLDGLHWEARPAPEGDTLDFRDVHALDAQRAWVLAAGPGPAGRIYATTDGGAHWTLQFANTDPGAFLDAFAFWDATHGLALGDVLQGRFQVLTTGDGGATWRPIPEAGLPEALPGEGAFAASGTCLITTGTREAWFVTGSAQASRVFHSSDRGRTWTVTDTPVPAGTPTQGLFSIAMTGRTGLLVGGDYQQKAQLPFTGARTEDGGRTWIPMALEPRGFHSAVLALPGKGPTFLSLGLAGTGLSEDGGRTWRALDPTPFHALAFRDGRAWAVGPGGRIARLSWP